MNESDLTPTWQGSSLTDEHDPVSPQGTPSPPGRRPQHIPNKRTRFCPPNPWPFEHPPKNEPPQDGGSVAIPVGLGY